MDIVQQHAWHILAQLQPQRAQRHASKRGPVEEVLRYCIAASQSSSLRSAVQSISTRPVPNKASCECKLTMAAARSQA